MRKLISSGKMVKIPIAIIYHCRYCHNKYEKAEMKNACACLTCNELVKNGEIK